jgi:hypothetical protein
MTSQLTLLVAPATLGVISAISADGLSLVPSEDVGSSFPQTLKKLLNKPGELNGLSKRFPGFPPAAFGSTLYVGTPFALLFATHPLYKLRRGQRLVAESDFGIEHTSQYSFAKSLHQSLAHSKWWTQNPEAELGKQVAYNLHILCPRPCPCIF